MSHITEGGMQKRLHKLRRSISGIAYGARVLTSSKFSRIRPSFTISLIALLGFATFVLAGGIYDILEHPISILSNAGRVSVLIPGTLGQQTLYESLISAILYMLGLGGLYLILRSTRFAYRPRNAYLLLIIGTFTILSVVFYSNALLTSKING